MRRTNSGSREDVSIKSTRNAPSLPPGNFDALEQPVSKNRAINKVRIGLLKLFDAFTIHVSSVRVDLCKETVMGKQYNKAEKRKRRENYRKRRKDARKKSK